MTNETSAPVATPAGNVYTPEMIEEMRSLSPITNETADKLSKKFGFSIHSVRAKAVRTEGIEYQAKGRTSKDGSPVESKADIVADIATSLGTDVESVESLANATKLALQKVRDALA